GPAHEQYLFPGEVHPAPELGQGFFPESSLELLFRGDLGGLLTPGAGGLDVPEMPDAGLRDVRVCRPAGREGDGPEQRGDACHEGEGQPGYLDHRNLLRWFRVSGGRVTHPAAARVRRCPGWTAGEYRESAGGCRKKRCRRITA